MAQLTLSAIGQMAATQSFIERVKIGLMSKSHYFNNFAPSTLSEVNLQLQKRKRFCRGVINGNYPDMYAFALYLLQLYTVSNPDLNGDNQLSDAVLANGTYMDPAIDFFAGTQASDADEPIIW